MAGIQQHEHPQALDGNYKEANLGSGVSGKELLHVNCWDIGVQVSWEGERHCPLRHLCQCHQPHYRVCQKWVIWNFECVHS